MSHSQHFLQFKSSKLGKLETKVLCDFRDKRNSSIMFDL